MSAMRRSALLIAALAVCAQFVAAASQGSAQTLDSEDVTKAFQEFFGEVRAAVDRETTSWRERAAKARTEVQSKLHRPSTDAAPVRRLLTTDVEAAGAKLELTKDLLAKGWELIVDAGSAVRNVVGLGATRVQDFFVDVLGPTWEQWVPPAWRDGSFTWERLANFDFESNLQDFLNSDTLRGLTRPQSLGELYDSMDGAMGHFCSPDDYDSGRKVPTTCTGPYIQLVFEPKTCIIDTKDKQVVCEPAKLVLYKYPGECNLKYHSAATWTGKECKLAKKCGFSKDIKLGGKPHTVPMGDLNFNDVHDWASGLFQADTASTASAPAPATPL